MRGRRGIIMERGSHDEDGGWKEGEKEDSDMTVSFLLD